VTSQKINERVLVTGASGMLGTYLVEHLNETYEELLVVEHNTKSKYGKSVYLDLVNINEVRRQLDHIKPTIIINLAALTDVDDCEKNWFQADVINHKLPKELAEYWHRSKLNGLHEVFVVHISTDYVFDGVLGNYNEESVCNPVNEYGRTKLLGELAIRSTVPEQNWCIARMCSIFGIHTKKKTFPVYAIENLLRGQNVTAVVDQYNSPSYVVNVSDMLYELIKNKAFGTFHISGSSRLSRYEQAIKIAEELGVDTSLIIGKNSAEMNWAATRPPDSSLDVNKAQTTMSNKPLDFDTALRTFILEIKKGGYFSF
jgi:dTDP-4-dehydrorhamnose reductase